MPACENYTATVSPRVAPSTCNTWLKIMNFVGTDFRIRSYMYSPSDIDHAALRLDEQLSGRAR